ncbi:MAG: hypothetical protein KME28_16105 [Pelatocladus maniniholoensis HA4357-MV3]|uniref:Uncharacterized protein n=1 Tax=Pelatocladus maniniholoensis HA4357-MV3 TaxID=1117104 RepID=A0A9E3LUD9_9NOST|nr:hypothetical protein [Pelatocladus maniniholoensis HA4357-MV3]
MNQNNSEILKIWDVFPSPRQVVDLLIKASNIQSHSLCLEPSAGFGDLAIAMRECGAIVEVIEPIVELQSLLTLEGFTVIGSDFISTANLLNRYHSIIQNPPFSQQISHIKKAYYCLSSGGRLVSLVSNTPWQYNSSFYKQFRHWLTTVNAQVEELPWGLFVNSKRYTKVECCLITINKL